MSLKPPGSPNPSLKRSGTKRAPNSRPKPKSYKDLENGIKTLYPPDKSNVHPDVDIVLVPGLGADPERCWMHPETEFDWTTDDDGLVKDFPRARVLLYCSQSAWVGRFKVQQYIEPLASNLLRGLAGERERCPQRPICFISHSMGGLVVAKAVAIANLRRDLFPAMFEAIAGCFFFGTPFNGSPAALFGSVLAQVGEKVDLAEQSKLLEFMKPGNEGLRDLKMEFMRLTTLLSQKIELVCFHETQSTYLKTGFFSFNSILPRDTTMVVDRDSATLDGVESIALDSDHPGLVKFRDFKDQRYDRLIRPSLKRIIHGSSLIVKNRFNSARGVDQLILNNIMDKLDGAHVNASRKALEKKYAPSPWISREKEYIDWLDTHGAPGNLTDRKSHKECLWIRGQEGRGKTNAMVTALGDIEGLIAEERAHTETPILFAYFFCDLVSAYAPAEALLRSLVSQLILQQEMLAPCAKRFIKEGSHDNENMSRVQAPMTVENLWQTLQEILADKSLSGRVYFVINNLHALPEDADSTKKLLKFINEELLDTGGRHSERQVELKWLLTSRDSVHIKEAFKLDGASVIDLEDERYGSQIQSELRQYAEKKVESLGNQKNYTKALTFFAGSTLGKQAPNTQWIDTVVALLEEQMPEGTPESKVRQSIKDYPQNPRKLLDRAWSQIFSSDDDDKIKEVLRVLVLTYEDPTMQELEVLADIQTDESDENKLSEIVEKCKPLLIVKNAPKGQLKVCFLNSSVKSHLMENESLLGLPREEVKMQHGLMSLRSFSHLTERLPFYDPSKASRYDDAKAKAHAYGRYGRRDSLDDARSDEYDADEAAHEKGELPDSQRKDGSRREQAVMAYAVKHWLHHASEAPLGIAENLSSEEDFWRTESRLRRRWLVEYTRLTNEFKGFQPEALSAMHVAASIGFRGLVAALIKNNHQKELDEHDTSWNTPLHLAAHFGHAEIIEVLLDNGADIDHGVQEARPTPLHKAAFNGNIKIINQLLGHGAKPNAISKDIGPVINAAIRSGNLGAVEILMEAEKEAPLDTQKNDFPSPLAAAALCSDLSVFENLTKAYSDGSHPEEFSKALLAAAAAGRVEVCKKLLSHKHTQEYLQEALDSAAQNAKWVVVRLLLEVCSGLNCEALLMQTALCSGEQIETLEAVWRYPMGNLRALTVDTALYEATDREKASTIKFYLEKFHGNPNATGDEYGNALTASAYDGTLHILRVLMDAGADINSPHGWALQTAAAQGHYDVVEELLKRGANVNACVTNRYFERGTALQAACETGKDDIVALLLEYNADPDLGAGSDTCPLIAAARRGEDQILRHLIKAKPKTNVFGGPDQSSPLIYAAGSASANSVRLLLNAGAEVNLPDKDGNTALIMASSRGDKSCVEVLLDSGADITLTNDIPPDNINAIQAAVQSGDLGCIEVLVNRVSGILNKLKPTTDFVVKAKLEPSADLGVQCELDPSPRPIPPEELNPTADFGMQCEMKIQAEAAVQCDIMPAESFFTPPTKTIKMDRSEQAEADDIDLQNLVSSVETTEDKDVALKPKKTSWRKVPTSMKAIKQMKVKQLTKQFSNKHPETPIDDNLQAAFESAVDMGHDEPETAADFLNKASFEGHPGLERQPSYERQNTFESQASTVGGRASLSSIPEAFANTSRGSIHSRASFTKSPDMTSEGSETVFGGGTSVMNTPAMTLDSPGMTTSSLQSPAPFAWPQQSPMQQSPPQELDAAAGGLDYRPREESISNHRVPSWDSMPGAPHSPDPAARDRAESNTSAPVTRRPVPAGWSRSASQQSLSPKSSYRSGDAHPESAPATPFTPFSARHDGAPQDRAMFPGPPQEAQPGLSRPPSFGTGAPHPGLHRPQSFGAGAPQPQHMSLGIPQGYASPPGASPVSAGGASPYPEDEAAGKEPSQQGRFSLGRRTESWKTGIKELSKSSVKGSAKTFSKLSEFGRKD